MIAQSEKQELFDRIVTENKGRFIFIAKHYVSREDVADLYQEIVKQIWMSLDRFESRSSPNTWAYSVAIHTAETFRRNDSRHLRAREQYRHHVGHSGQNYGHGRGEEEILEEFVKVLDEADRSVFMLYLTNLSYSEISGITGIQEPTLRVKINRIKTKFQKRYLGD